MTRILVALVLCSFGFSQPVDAQNGDVLLSAPHCETHAFLVGATDLVQDPTNGDLYVLDGWTGKICRYTVTSTALVSSGTLNNPFGSTGFPVPVNRSVGIAFDSTGLLQILNDSTTQGLRLGSLDPQTGNAVNLTTVAGAPPGGQPRGLTFDTNTNSLWYRNVANNTLVNVSTTGQHLTTMTIPGLEPHEVAYGTGISFAPGGTAGFLTLTFGSAATLQTDRTIRIDVATGELEPESTDLSQLYSAGSADSSTNPVTGVAPVVSETSVFVSTANEIYKVNAVQPAVHAPTSMACTSLRSGAIHLSWINQGSGVPVGANSDYVELVLTRTTSTGTTSLAVLPGDTTDYVDGQLGVDDEATYRLAALDSTGASVESACENRLGRGALMRSVPFLGASPHDLAVSSARRELFVSDMTISRGSLPGTIYVYDSELILARTLTSPVGPARALCYDSTRDRLVMTRGDVLHFGDIVILDPDSGSALQSVPLSYAVDAMAYDPSQDEYVLIDETSNQAFRLDAATWSLISSCQLPLTDFVGGTSATGLGTFLTVVATPSGTALVELDLFQCTVAPGPTPFPIGTLGASAAIASHLTGVAHLADTVILANTATNSLTQFLVRPGTDFLRGDVSRDNAANVADAVQLLGYLFVPNTPTPPCLDAADVNDDGSVDVVDAVSLLNHLFVPGSPPPHPPYPNPGLDFSVDSIDCPR